MEDTMRENPILAAALDYLSRGWSVIPVGRDKRPLILWADYQKRLPTEEEVRNWWRKYPNANVAIVTGAVSKLIVVDIDPRNGGNESVKQINLPATYIVKTGGGGTHCYYQWTLNEPPPSKTGHLPGIDIQGEGKIVIAPPSIHQSGSAYDVVTTWDQLADAPEWFTKQAVGTPKELWKEGVAGVEEGKRNDTAASIIGKMLHHIPPFEWEALVWPLVEAWNGSNKQPLPSSELRLTFESIAKIDVSKKKPPSADPTPFLPAITLKDLCEQNFPEAKWLVHGIYQTGVINMISAPPNQYKSWVVQHIAICVAKGAPVFGQFATDRQNVLIVNEEDPAPQLKERSLMLVESDDDFGLPIYFLIEKGIKLDDVTIERLSKEIKEKNIGLIIFDSLRAIHSASENDSSEMQAVMDQLRKFCRDGITVLVTHHNRKRALLPSAPKDDFGEDARGSTAILAAIHGLITCESKEIDGKTFLLIQQKKLKAAKKIGPFKVLIDTSLENSLEKMKFKYDGEYRVADETSNKVRAAILFVLETSSDWLSKKDFERMRIGGSRMTSDVLADLVMTGQIQRKYRKDLENSGHAFPYPGKHNANYYFRNDGNPIEMVDTVKAFAEPEVPP